MHKAEIMKNKDLIENSMIKKFVNGLILDGKLEIRQQISARD
jgi:hypothetical protein